MKPIHEAGQQLPVCRDVLVDAGGASSRVRCHATSGFAVSVASFPYDAYQAPRSGPLNRLPVGRVWQNAAFT